MQKACKAAFSVKMRLLMPRLALVMMLQILDEKRNLADRRTKVECRQLNTV